MCNFLKKLFTKPAQNKEVVKQTTADAVRKYAREKFITPARQRGDKTVSFTSSDIHKGMGLVSRYPLVCSAIDAAKFAAFARVTLIRREGKKQSSTVKWTFKV